MTNAIRVARRALLLLLLAWLPALGFAQSDPVAAREVDALVADIAGLKSAVFIRNGSQYDAAKAAEHLRLAREARERLAGGGTDDDRPDVDVREPS